MPKYLYQARFAPEGAAGLRREGGTSRRDTIGALAEAHGGSLESFHFAFGDVDVFLIVDMPDNATAAALALAVSASGAVGVETTVLLTPEEVDTATSIEVDYRPPGG
ncbi:MAG: GYD domain-containing protein [Actinobacteria bacterium]|nr:GYD domain-containing protein [Actinomycetota bacterium]